LVIARPGVLIRRQPRRTAQAAPRSGSRGDASGSTLLRPRETHHDRLQDASPAGRTL